MLGGDHCGAEETTSSSKTAISDNRNLDLPAGGVEPADMDGSGTEELRLVLFGNTRSGKSASANTIVGRRLFMSKMGASSVTQICQLVSTDITVEEEVEEKGRTVTVRRNRRVTVVDTPGLGDTHLSEDQIHTEIAQSVCLSAPGPHAFLLVVPIGQYTENENQVACQFIRMFGEDAVRHHTVILFTKGDELELDDTTIEEYLREAPESLCALINRCGGRYHVFNNRDPNNLTQVKDLLMKVDNMVMQNNNNNNNGFYTNAMYEEAVAAIREEQRLWEEQRLREQRRVQAPEGRGESRRRRVRARRQTTRSSSGSMGSQGPGFLRVLQRVKVVVAAVATGVVVGAVFGAAVPFIAAATACGTTALTVGAGVGAFIGGATGALIGADAESLGEAALETFRQVGGMGIRAVGMAAGAGIIARAGVGALAGPGQTAVDTAVTGLFGLAVLAHRRRRSRYE